MKPGATDASVTDRKPRLRELDLLRFVAAAAVMSYHFTGTHRWSGWGDPSKIFPEISKVTNYGFMGVNLFFVISGFVILMSAWGRSPGQFAESRFVRLFPAYWAAVLLTVAVYVVAGDHFGYLQDQEGPLWRFLPNMTMLQDGVGAPRLEMVYWTLWVELHFYALVALLVWRGITYRNCVIFMAGWLLIGAFALEAKSKLLMEMLVPASAPYFIAGMAFFLIYRFGGNLILWLFVGFSWALCCYYSITRLDMINAISGYKWVQPLIVSAIYGVMVLVVSGKLSWLNWRGLTTLGALTYPLYLVHETVSRPLIVRLKPDLDRWAVLAISVAASLSAAYILYRLVEQPAQRWMRPRLKKALAEIRANGVLSEPQPAKEPAESAEPAQPNGARPAEPAVR